jgi:sulfide:quinone oxidoreductase
MATQSQFQVVIAGGGVAALESVLALLELAGDRVAIRLVAPNAEFHYRPEAVREPFARGHAQRHSLPEIADDLGVELICDELGWIDAGRRTAHTKQGRSLPYDALLLALGARMRRPFAHGLTIDDGHMDDLLHGLVQDVEGGYTRRIAFVSPGRMGWLLPLYELALMTAGRAYDMDVEVELTLVTPETAPLAIFGDPVSAAVAALLDEAGITTICSAYAEVAENARVVIHPGNQQLDVDRVVALPELMGPTVAGLPAGERGFIPVDQHGQVRGVPRVFAAGDATDFPLKHGGLAAQQANAAAQAIAALAGAPVTPELFTPELSGVMLTGGKPRYLTARIAGGEGFSSTISEEPPPGQVAKIAARHLAPYLAQRDVAAAGRSASD